MKIYLTRTPMDSENNKVFYTNPVEASQASLRSGGGRVLEPEKRRLKRDSFLQMMKLSWIKITKHELETSIR